MDFSRVLFQSDVSWRGNRRRISVGEFRPESGEAAEILVVSLESAEARRAAFAARAVGTSLAWRFFDACTAPAPGMTIDEAAIRRNKGRAMSKGAIGCYASHFSIWRDMIERGVRQAIVLEDETVDRKSTRPNSSPQSASRIPPSACTNKK